MSTMSPEPQDTGDVAAVPAEQRLETDHPEDHAEPVDLSDVDDKGNLVDLESVDEPTQEETADASTEGNETAAQTSPESEGTGEEATSG